MRSYRLAPLAVLTAAALILTACGGTGGSGDPATNAAGDTVLTVGASPVPHAQILQYIDDNLAAAAGIDLEVVEYTDYVQPNVALQEGDIDANFFQHVPYLESEIADKGYEFSHSEGVHIEPYGVYSQKVESLAALADGATVSVPNDPSNQARALRLLEAQGVFTLDPGVEDPTMLDLTENPKNITVTEMDAAQLPRTLQDVDAAVINGNFALEAGLNPAEDALVLESGEDNPYANVLAYRTEDARDEGITTLDDLLHSPEVRQYLEQTWPNKEIIPAF